MSEMEERELTPTEKLAVKMTDPVIADAIDLECETILRLVIHDRTEEIPLHAGAIRGWSSMLRGRAARMPK